MHALARAPAAPPSFGRWHSNMSLTALPIEDVWLDLNRKSNKLSSTVPVSELALELIRDFDYETDGTTTFAPYETPLLPDNFKIGVIVGASGTGKSTLLADFGKPVEHPWDSRAICDHFDNAQDAQAKLFAVGLTSVPTWLKPYNVLSNGEKFRADLAVSLHDDAVIDEYTSVVDRNIAIAASKSLRKYVNSNNIQRLVIVTCHRDVIPWLEPDWIIDTDAGAYVIEPKECLHRPEMVVEVFEAQYTAWELFGKHHYLSADLSQAARCYLATFNGSPVGFVGALPLPSGTVRDAWRESRLVTLPDYQGLGLGPRFSDYVANGFTREGKRYFSKTAHPRLGEYRERSKEWRGTSTNKSVWGEERVKKEAERNAKRNKFTTWTYNAVRFTYSHEFIGTKED